MTGRFRIMFVLFARARPHATTRMYQHKCQNIIPRKWINHTRGLGIWNFSLAEVKSVDLLGSACLGHSTDRWEFVLAFVLGLHVHSGSTWASGSVLTGCHHDVVVSVSRKSHGTDKVEEVVRDKASWRSYPRGVIKTPNGVQQHLPKIS